MKDKSLLLHQTMFVAKDCMGGTMKERRKWDDWGGLGNMSFRDGDEGEGDSGGGTVGHLAYSIRSEGLG